MKRLVPIFLLLAVAWGQTSTPPSAQSQSIPADQENVRKAKALIDQMTQALGGQAYLNVQDSSQEGRTYSFHHGQPNSLGVLYWRVSNIPDKDRNDITLQRD